MATAATRRRSVRNDELYQHEQETEAQVSSDDEQRSEPTQAFRARESQSLCCENGEPQREGQPYRGTCGEDANSPEQQRRDGRHCSFHDRPLTMRDVSELGERDVLVMREAVAERVRIDVREPERYCGDGNQCGDVSGVVRIGASARDDDRESHDRPIDKAGQALAEGGASDASSCARSRGHSGIIKGTPLACIIRSG